MGGWVPLESWGERLGAGELGFADEEGQAAGGGDQAGCYWEGGVEALDCSQGYYVGGRVGVVLGASGEYIDVRQCKAAGDFAQEGGFLVVGFDQGQVDLGRPDFYGQAGEAGAGADVDQTDRLSRRDLGGEEVGCGEQGFSEVASDDFFLIVDGGEVDAGVPAEQ